MQNKKRTVKTTLQFCPCEKKEKKIAAQRRVVIYLLDLKNRTSSHSVLNFLAIILLFFDFSELCGIIVNSKYFPHDLQNLSDIKNIFF